MFARLFLAVAFVSCGALAVNAQSSAPDAASAATTTGAEAAPAPAATSGTGPAPTAAPSSTPAPTAAPSSTPAPAAAPSSAPAAPVAPARPQVTTPAAPAASNTVANAATAPRTPSVGVELPAGYIIGPEDALEVVFWREKDLSPEGNVLVRPDGKISLPLINDIQAAGLTPDQLREHLADAAAKYVTDPTVTVTVKSISSRKVYITGNVAKSAYFPLMGPTTVMQLIATAGGVSEYAKSQNIRITRTENGKTTSYRFNYKQFLEGKNLAQNIELKPGDIVTVP